jgi:putative membrane protein
MIRLLARMILELLANAVGLLVATWLLDGFSMSASAFAVVVVIYSVLKFVLDPLILKMSIQYVPALRGGIALVTTLVSLVITSALNDGLQIKGVDTWILATLIVWLFGLIASLLLPVFVFKNALSDDDDGRGSSSEERRY